MLIVSIEANELGGHDNNFINGFLGFIPEGWAVIPDDMECENFPFGEVEVTEIDGVMTVTKWTPGTVPEPESKSPAEQREEAYNTETIIEWDGDMITVTQASQLWQYYAAEGSDKAGELQALIASAKAEIREKFPNE